MDEVRARLAPGREVTPGDFADLTDVEVESITWAEGGELAITFADVLPEQARAAVKRRIMSQTAREEELRADAETYLTDPEPDLTEIRAQVTRLTEIVLGKTET